MLKLGFSKTTTQPSSKQTQLLNKKIPAERDSTQDNSMAGCTPNPPKQNRNRTETKMHYCPRTNSRQNAHICEMFQCSVLFTLADGCSHVNPSRGASRKMKNMWSYVRLRPAIHSSHQENPTKTEFLGEADTVWTKNINSHVSSVRHTALWAGCRQRELQHNRNPLSFTDRRRNSAETHKQGAEMFYKCCRTAADQICSETMSFSFVSWLWTLPRPCAHLTSIQLRHGWTNWTMHVKPKRY